MEFSVLNDGTLVDVVRDPGRHALLAPSSSHRWSKCPGSLNEHIRKPSGHSALEGNAAHMLLEYVGRTVQAGDRLRTVSRVAVQKGEPEPVYFEATEEMKSAVRLALQQTKGFPIVRFELPVIPLTQYKLELFGTSDIVCVNPDAKEGEPRLRVIDLKYGRVPVHPWSEQLQLYLIGALVWAVKEHGIKWRDTDRVETCVVQPRAPGDPVRSCQVFVKEARTIGGLWRDIVSDLVATHKENEGKPVAFTEFSAGEHCSYCPHATRCGTLREHADRIAADNFPAILDNPDIPTDKYLADCAKILPAVKIWVAQVEDALREALSANPEAVPTHKLVTGAGRREWIREARYSLPGFMRENLLSDKIPVMEMRSVAAIERDLPPILREKIAKYYTRGTPRKILVTVSDPRPAINPADDFTDEEELIHE